MPVLVIRYAKVAHEAANKGLITWPESIGPVPTCIGDLEVSQERIHVELVGKCLGGRQRLVNHVRGCHDRQVAPFPADRGLAQRDGPF